MRSGPNWTFSYALNLVHDTETKTTLAFLTGLPRTRKDIVLRLIRETSHFAAHYLHLPLFMIDAACDSLGTQTRDNHLKLNDYQVETGMHGFINIDPLQISERPGEGLNLPSITQRLTALSDLSATDNMTCTMLLHSLSIMEDVHAVIQSKVATTGQTERVVEMLDYFSDQRHALKQILKTLQTRITYVDRSTQGQIQTVYSLIAQRDNRLNIEAAEASRQIAEDSRKVAIDARRDSTDMRTISVVTLLFFPATFVATVFSTSFFNFQPSDQQRVVSWWIWLYWVVTVGLTLLVMGGWYYFSRVERQKLEKVFQFESEMAYARKSHRTRTQLTAMTDEPSRHRLPFLEGLRRRQHSPGSVTSYRHSVSRPRRSSVTNKFGEFAPPRRVPTGEPYGAQPLVPPMRSHTFGTESVELRSMRTVSSISNPRGENAN